MDNAIWLPGIPSTVSVMEWIRDHGCPMLKAQEFSFEDGYDSIIVSQFSKEELSSVLRAWPIKIWPVVLDMKRLTYSRYSWYFYINGSYYYASM